MKRLILMRHAKTEPWTEGVEDHGRALMPVGHVAAQNVSSALKRDGWCPEAAIVSTARRTRETWAYLATDFPDCAVHLEDELYLAGERYIIELITQFQSKDTLLILGHNPGLHDMCVTLLREAGTRDHRAALRLSAKLPTGAAAVFEADESGCFIPSYFRLTDFIRPKDLV